MVKSYDAVTAFKPNFYYIVYNMANMIGLLIIHTQ